MQSKLSLTALLLATGCLYLVRAKENDRPPKDYAIQVQVSFTTEPIALRVSVFRPPAFSTGIFRTLTLMRCRSLER